MATGLVTDVQGRPLRGATIRIGIANRRYEDVTIGSGVTNPEGLFAVALSTKGYGDLGVGVDAPGFLHWGAAGFPRGVADETIVLRRVIDRAYLEALRSVEDPTEREARVLEIAASEDLPEIEEMFPYLAELRPELSRLARTPVLKPKAWRDGATPADHALRLLAYRADPADDDLLTPWMEGARGFKEVPAGLLAASPPEICALWRTAHFRAEGVGEPQTASYCWEPLLDASGTHALALFRVRYAHWAYDMHLVMRREGDGWSLRGVAENRIDHFR